MSLAFEPGVSPPAGSPPAPAPGGLGPALAGWAVVVLGAVVLLGVVDAIPGYISGRPRGVTPVGTVEQAERRLGGRLRLPAYFPDSLRWPPVTVDIYLGPPAAAAMAFDGAKGSAVRLVVCQTLEPAQSMPVKLLPPGLFLEAARTKVGDDRGTLTRIQLDDGRIVHELTWQDAGRLLVLRFDGSVEQLMMLARSMNADRL
jgi:hypothetical protein